MNNYNIDAYNSQSLDTRVSQVMKRVYVKMFLALLVTAGAAAIFAGVPNLTMFLASHRWVYWGLLIVELLMVFSITSAVNKISSPVATLLFFLFAIINGITFSLIFYAYSTVSIFKTFLITSAVFGAMSVYGYFTERDLTKIGNFLFMALIGIIIASVINLFWANSTLEWIVSIAGVLIFIGLTAWDTQKIKQMAQYNSGLQVSRLATIGALSLYLDFINLFLYLLRFFGSSRD